MSRSCPSLSILVVFSSCDIFGENYGLQLIGILFFRSRSTSLYVLCPCVFHFISFCREPLRRKLRLLLGAFAIMHLSAAIRGGDPGKPPGICTMTFTNTPYPKARLFLTKSHKRPSPGGKEVCSAKSNNELFQKTSI